jgi:hypothetical protein
MSSDKVPRPYRRRSPFAALSFFLLIAVLALGAALVLLAHDNSHQTTSTQATVVALKTEIAAQQHTIEQLQGIVVAERTPTYRADGLHSYVAAFQIDKYSYVLYLEWVESSGFIHNGRLLTTDNYGRKASKSFQFSGVDNNGSFGFTARVNGATITFSGTAHDNRTFTVSGLPWSVFNGFVGGTFSQTLHAGTLQEYNTDVANLSNPPP